MLPHLEDEEQPGRVLSGHSEEARVLSDPDMVTVHIYICPVEALCPLTQP